MAHLWVFQTRALSALGDSRRSGIPETAFTAIEAFPAGALKRRLGLPLDPQASGPSGGFRPPAPGVPSPVAVICGAIHDPTDDGNRQNCCAWCAAVCD
jgi:hypothetical protein